MLLIDDFSTRLSAQLTNQSVIDEAIAAGNAAGHTLAKVKGSVQKGHEGRQFSYGQLTDATEGFTRVVQRALDKDRREFHLLRKTMSLIPGATIFGLGLAAVQNHFDQAQKRTAMALVRFRAAVDQQLGRFQATPAELQEQAGRWDSLATRLVARSQQAQEWATVPGWVSGSAAEYAAAAQVQANAISELAGIMSTAARSCRSAAAINMIAFSLVAKITREQTDKLRGQLGFSFGLPYRRTERAAELTERLAEFLEQVIPLSRAYGASLSGAVSRATNSGNVIKPGSWPSGTAAASVAPAATDQGVDESTFYDQIRGG